MDITERIVVNDGGNIDELRKRYPDGLHFVVGDTHGQAPTLKALMDTIRFDPEKDHVYFVGDYNGDGDVKSLLEYMALYYQADYSRPGFHMIRGNHEWELWPVYELENLPDVLVLRWKQMTYYIVHAGLVRPAFDLINADLEKHPTQTVFAYRVDGKLVAHHGPLRQLIWSRYGLYSRHRNYWPSGEKLAQNNACILHGHAPYCFFVEADRFSYGDENLFWKKQHIFFSEDLQSFNLDANVKGRYANGESHRALACVCLESIEEIAAQNQRHLTVDAVKNAPNFVFSADHDYHLPATEKGNIETITKAAPEARRITTDGQGGLVIVDDKAFGCVKNASILDRIRDRDDWVLYVSDCYWALDMDGCVEFYFHPTHFLGRVRKTELPPRVMARVERHSKCFTPEDRKRNRPGADRLSWENMQKLISAMTIGNRFYYQGQNCVTVNGKVIHDDSFGDVYECGIRELSWSTAVMMMQTSASTRSHHYMQTLCDLPCFEGVSRRELFIRPLQEAVWDAPGWKAGFERETAAIREEGSEEARTILRFMRQEVFQHTVFLVRQGYYLTPEGKKVVFPDSKAMVKNTVLYEEKLSHPILPRFLKTKITVENMDCLVAAKMLMDKGLNPAVLNMANRQTPGGGVYQGAGAQEENLFRRTNLFRSMYQFAPFAGQYGVDPSRQQYPMDRNHGGVYSPEVVVFRGEEKEGYPLLDEYYQVAVISVAAMNRPRLTPEGEISPELVEGVKNKIRTILNIAIRHGHDSLVLGALGCGAFRNPPDHMARLFHQVIRKEYPGRFREICFAIIEDHNSGGAHNPRGNYLPFREEFMGK